MRRSFAFTLVAAILAAAPASAQKWVKVASTNQSDYLMALAAWDTKNLLMGGMRMDQGGGAFPTITTVLYQSQAGGKAAQPITPVPVVAGSVFPSPIADLARVDDTHVWALIGSAVSRSQGEGHAWLTKALGKDAAPAKMHMFDANSGIAIGGSGMAWITTDGWQTFSAEDTGSGLDLACMVWLDSLHGLAAGSHTETTQDQEGNDVSTITKSGVIATSDGGASWTAKADTGADRVPCPIFMLDGATGWLATTEQTAGADHPGPAHLLATTDGGKTFLDNNMDVTVGKGMFGMPVVASYWVGMFWADAQHGHLVGDAYLGSQRSGSSPTPIYRVVDFLTLDGGATWQKTDLAATSVGSGQVDSDGRMMAYDMPSLREGHIVGEGGNIFEYQFKCAADAD